MHRQPARLMWQHWDGSLFISQKSTCGPHLPQIASTGHATAVEVLDILNNTMASRKLNADLRKNWSFARVCRSKWRHCDTQPKPEDVIWHAADKFTNPYQTTITVNNQPLRMEIDTGAAVSLISKDQAILMFSQILNKCFPRFSLEDSLVVLRTYSAQSIPVLGVISVDVSQPSYSGRLTRHVVPGSGSTLLGSDWLKHACLDWASMSMATIPVAVGHFLSRFLEVFQGNLGTMRCHSYLSLCIM